MPADNFTATLGLQYTPPAAPANSGVASLAVAGTYNAGQPGNIDVPSGTAISTVFPIPFGSVSDTKLCVIRNNMSSDLGVRINGAVANNFELAPGGVFMYAGSAAPATDPLTSVSVVTPAVPATLEKVLFWTVGD